MTEKRMFSVALITTGGVNEDMLAQVARVTRGADLTVFKPSFFGPEQHEKDLELLRKIILYKHLSVLEFSNILYQIECPIYIARQLMRYRCSSFLERSLRVCGPMDGDGARLDYEDAIKRGEKREDARALLPLSTRTRFLWLLNLRELLHIAEERLTPAAQYMTQCIVGAMVDIAAQEFPHVIGFWKEQREGATCQTK